MDGENVGLLIAFAAGLLSFLSPCVLPLVPVYIGHMVAVGTDAPESGRRTASFVHALIFVAGFSAVFVGFWSLVGVLGFVFLDNARYIREAAGALLIFMGLHLLGVLTIPFLDRQYTSTAEPAKPGYPRSLLMGVTFAAGWTPCIGPVLGSIIGIAVVGGSVAHGALLLAAYSAGMGVPFVVVAVAAENASSWLKRRRRVRAMVPIVSGALVVGVGFLMLTGTLVQLNQFFDWGYA